MERQIEKHLREINFHPDLIVQVEEQCLQLILDLINPLKQGLTKKSQVLDELESMNFSCESQYSQINDMHLLSYEMSMIKRYYNARVGFLEHALGYIKKKNGKSLDLIDDGCGTGVDLYCLRHILGENVKLSGVDPSLIMLKKAKSRNPNLYFSEIFGKQKYDFILSDFLDFFSGPIHDVTSNTVSKSLQWKNALKDDGLIVQNVDIGNEFIDVYKDLLSLNLNLVREEVIAEIPGDASCRLLVWEKYS